MARHISNEAAERRPSMTKRFLETLQTLGRQAIGTLHRKPAPVAHPPLVEFQEFMREQRDHDLAGSQYAKMANTQLERILPRSDHPHVQRVIKGFSPGYKIIVEDTIATPSGDTWTTNADVPTVTVYEPVLHGDINVRRQQYQATIDGGAHCTTSFGHIEIDNGTACFRPTASYAPLPLSTTSLSQLQGLLETAKWSVPQPHTHAV